MVRTDGASGGVHLLAVRYASVGIALLVTVQVLFQQALSGQVFPWLLAFDGVALAVFAAVWFAMAGRVPADATLSRITLLITGLAATHSLLNIYFTSRLQFTAGLALIIVGAAAITPAWWTLVVLYCGCATAWAALTLSRHLGTPEILVNHAILLVAAGLVAATVYWVRQVAGRSLRDARDRLAEQLADLRRTEDSRAESERRFREVFVASPVGIALADENGLFTEVNPAWCELLGRTPAELMGRSSREFTHPDDLAQHASMADRMGAAAPQGGVVRVEKRYIRPNGEIRWGWLSAAPVHGPQGQAWTLAHVQDVTERKQAEAALRRSEATLAASARVSKSVQSGEDPRPTVLEAIRDLAHARSVRLYEEADLGDLVMTASVGLPAAPGPMPTGMAGEVWRTGEPRFLPDPRTSHPEEVVLPGVTHMVWHPVTEGGTVIAVLAVSWTEALSGPQDPLALSVQNLATESASALTAARLRTELEALVETDPLTGVANRRGWHARLREMTSTTKRTGKPLTLAVVDLDNFKLYNDTFGHHEGDALLQEFAVRTQRLLRSVDLVARWGGEEFAVALPGCSAADSGPILDRLRALVPNGQTCSIGHATLRPDETATQCLMRADTNLYEAKRAGRNRVIGASN